MAIVIEYQVGFLDKLLQEVAERDKDHVKPQPIDITNMSRDEVIDHACNAVWELVPTQGATRDRIDFHFATTEQIKKWLVINYNEFFYLSFIDAK